MRISIAGDHAGVAYKTALIEFLTAQGHQVTNHGTNTTDSCDYPDFAHPLANAVVSKESELGVLICGSANGVAMTANKHANVRAAICWEVEIAALARQHNDANVVCIPARFITLDKAKEIVDTFVSTAFEGGRHLRRVEKIAC